MEKLPTDIILDILSCLPYETIINCKLVCKPWRDISRNIKVGLLFQFGWDPDFKLCYGGEEYDHIDMHGHYSYNKLVEIDNHRSIELEDPLNGIVGSCNGLVCFSVKGKSKLARDPIYICNPITEEYVYLPPFNNYEIYNGNMIGCFICGFGYNHSTDEYKVVRIYRRDCSRREIEVYTLGSGHGWRARGRTGGVLDLKPGVYANGALHWKDYTNNRIAAFDLADEEFRSIPFPSGLPRILHSFYNWLDPISLKLLGGYLCVVHIAVGKVEDVIDIWALEKKKQFSSYNIKKHEFDDFWRWNKKFSIPCTKDVTYMPFAFTKTNQVLMSHHQSVFCYDSETTIIRKLWDDGPSRSIQAIPHMNSLISLESLGEKSKRRK